MINQELALKIIRTLSQYRPKRIAVFGSYVRGEQQPESDLDILIDFMDRKSLFDLVHIENELSYALGIKVDLFDPFNQRPLAATICALPF